MAGHSRRCARLAERAGRELGLADDLVDVLDPGAHVLAAVDIYVCLTTDRADRRAFAVQDAAHELRRLAAQWLLAHDTTEAVLAAAGHSP